MLRNEIKAGDGRRLQVVTMMGVLREDEEVAGYYEFRRLFVT